MFAYLKDKSDVRYLDVVSILRLLYLWIKRLKKIIEM